MATIKALRSNIRGYCTDLGLSQEEVAERIGIATRAVSEDRSRRTERDDRYTTKDNVYSRYSQTLAAVAKVTVRFRLSEPI